MKYKTHSKYYWWFYRRWEQILLKIGYLKSVEMVYAKYKNNYGWCNYPFCCGGIDYCWGYACNVDDNKTRIEILKYCSEKDNKNEYYCEYYNKDYINELQSAIELLQKAGDK